MQPPPRGKAPTAPPPTRGRPPLPKPFEEPTRAMRDDELLRAVRAAPGPGRSVFDEPTRMGSIDPSAFDNIEDNATRADPNYNPKFIDASTEHAPMQFDEEATRMANIDRGPRGNGNGNEERTRAVDIRQDSSISDIDWDID
jgi:hypothetical protein